MNHEREIREKARSSSGLDTLLTSRNRAVFDVSSEAETEVRTRAHSVDARWIADGGAFEGVKDRICQGIARSTRAFVRPVSWKK